MHRSSDALLDKVFVKREIIKRLHIEGNSVDVLWGHPDTDRLIRCFERIARGLYYHHFNEPLSRSAFVRVMLGFVVPLDSNALTFQQFIRKKAEQELAGKPSYGSNPEVFYYQVSDSDQFGYFVFFMRFYGGVVLDRGNQSSRGIAATEPRNGADKRWDKNTDSAWR